MDSVFRSARTNKTGNHHAARTLNKHQELFAIRSAKYLKGYELCLRFNDETMRVIDFAPFLQQSKNPLIRQYLDIAKFKAFKVTRGDLQWNDYDLCFPINDLYENKLMRRRARRKAISHTTASRNGARKMSASKRVAKQGSPRTREA